MTEQRAAASPPAGSLPADRSSHHQSSRWPLGASSRATVCPMTEQRAAASPPAGSLPAGRSSHHHDGQLRALSSVAVGRRPTKSSRDSPICIPKWLMTLRPPRRRAPAGTAGAELRRPSANYMTEAWRTLSQPTSSSQNRLHITLGLKTEEGARPPAPLTRVPSAAERCSQ